MKTFEYKIATLSLAEDEQSILNMMGAEGWELCSVMRLMQRDEKKMCAVNLYYFKREKQA